MGIEDEVIRNRKLEFQEQLIGYTDDQIKVINKSLSKAQRELIQHLKNKGANIKEWDERRSIALLSEMNSLTAATQEALGEQISEISGSVGSRTLDSENSILSFDGKIAGFNDVSLSTNQYTQLVKNTAVNGRLLQESLKDGTESWINRAFTKTLQEDIEKDILTGVIKGESYPALVKRIESGYNITKNEAAMLARTYVQSANVGAMQSVYDENPDVVKKVQWTATLEISVSRTKKGKRTGKGTCMFCAGLDGRIFPVDKHPDCPLHINCKCFLSPITVTWRELGLDVDEMEKEYRPWTHRSEKSDILKGGKILGQGDADFNFDEFYLKQGKKFQTDVVGPRRQELISDGRVQFKDIIKVRRDQTVKIRTLDELKQLEKRRKDY